MAARGMNAEERERKRKLDEEAKRDVMLMAIATISIMVTIGALMVYDISPLTYYRNRASRLMRNRFFLHTCSARVSTSPCSLLLMARWPSPAPKWRNRWFERHLRKARAPPFRLSLSRRQMRPSRQPGVNCSPFLRRSRLGMVERYVYYMLKT